MTTDAKNQNISLKDLKEFALLYSTISAQDTFLNKTIGNNNFDVTNLRLKDTS